MNFIRRLNKGIYLFFKLEFSNFVANWWYESMEKYKISAQYL